MQEFETIIEGLTATVSERVKYLKEMSGEFASIHDFRKADHKTASAIERDLQVAIEACIDIGKIIISEKGLRPPETMRDVCQVLYETGFIDKMTLKEFEGMVGLRNILVHRYERIDPEIIYGVLKRHLKDFNRFLKQIKKKIHL
jgi:uncharacterized protein YutE (UPF0331/DUF86 family)